MQNSTIKKPIIRHCRNCQWGKQFDSYTSSIKCMVRYEYVNSVDQRLKALLCWHYKKRTENNVAGDSSAE